MKKIVYCLVAALALVACTPKDGADQVVRIGVSLDDNTLPNQKGQQRISAVDGADEIDINWEKDDVLYYKSSEQEINTTNPFKLISGEGTKQAFFECENFGDLNGVEFDLYYQGASTPDFSNSLVKHQVVTINKDGNTEINNDYLLYTATNCKLYSSISLKPHFTVLGVKFEGTLENLGDKLLVIGNEYSDKRDNWMYSCKLNIEDEDQKAGLTKSPIYFFVIPCDDNSCKLTNLKIWLAHDHPTVPSNCCETRDIKELDLTRGQATIIKFNIAKGSSTHNFNQLVITPIL